MTEAEWMSCTSPEPMLEFLRGKASDRKLHSGMSSRERKLRLRKPSDRKQRLFAVACCRRIANLFVGVYYEKAVEVAEQLAEGRATKAEKRTASFAPSGSTLTSVWFACSSALGGSTFHAATSAAFYAACAVALAASCEDSQSPVWRRQHYDEECSAQSSLLRDIFGNPFCPVSLNQTWQTHTVLALAQAAYEERIMPAGTLDPDRLAVLADALEDSGSADAAILEHLRGPGPHVRGCFAVDILLNRE